MKNIEIEIQVRVENNEPLLEFLQKNAEFKAEKHQVDEYFSPAHRDFLEVRPVKEWFRLRNADGKYSINYKNWHFDDRGKSHYCDEYESEIEDLEKVKKILQVLSFKSLVIVDKVRKIFIYKDYEIAIDSVKSLGDFVEIEYIGQEDRVEPEKITSEMINFLVERNYVGYPFQILFREEIKK